jgi:Rieske Fe-S protein
MVPVREMAAPRLARRDLLKVLCASTGAMCAGVASCGDPIVRREELVALPVALGGRILIPLAEFPQLLNVGGCVVGESAGMPEPLAIARDKENHFLVVSALCTHMTCILRFNELNLTLDCPCHGSRFEVDGSVINGPALTPLRSLTTIFDGKMLSVLVSS